MIHLDTSLSVMGSTYQMSNLGSTVSDKEQEYIKAAMHKRFPTRCTSADFPAPDALLDNNID
jgi:acetyl-CoA carboxylase beta subunit